LYPTKPRHRRLPTSHSPSLFTGIDYSDLSIELSSKVEHQRRRRWIRHQRSDQQRQDTGEELGSDSDSDDNDDESDDDHDSDESPDPKSSSPSSEHATWFTSDLLTCTLSSLHTQSPSVPLEGWDLVLDKGTYDAIALSQLPVSSGPSAGSLPSIAYPERVAELVKPGGFFLITCECPEAVANVLGGQTRGIDSSTIACRLQHAILRKKRSRPGSVFLNSVCIYPTSMFLPFHTDSSASLV